MHLAGQKGALGSRDRQELREAIEDHRVGLVPVAVPLVLLSRHLRAAGTEWTRSQTYLRPYPKELVPKRPDLEAAWRAARLGREATGSGTERARARLAM